jgi:hypothetical protein
MSNCSYRAGDFNSELAVNLFLHIGTEKTGTTSVQKFMATNRALLQRDGVLYPEAPGTENHLALTAVSKRRRNEIWDKLGLNDEAVRRAFCDNLREKLAAELSGSSCETVIMSGEHCSSRLRSVDDVRRLYEFLAPFFSRMSVVVYLRRQDDFLMSTHSTDVKNGSVRPLEVPDEEEVHFRYDYWELLSRWSGVFGRENIVCRKYGKGFLKDDSIVSDFLQAVGIARGADYQLPGNMNESLDADCLEFLRLLNKHLKGTERLQKIVAALQGISAGPLIDLSPQERSSFMGALRESNRRVALEYFDGEAATSDDPLFGPRLEDRPRVEAGQLTAERAVDIAANLFARFRAAGEALGRPERPPRGQMGTPSPRARG